MVRINKNRCNGFNGEVQDASPLHVENTQEYQDVVAMGKFKLSTSMRYLAGPFDQLADSMQNLWLNEGIQVPGFALKFVDCWSSDDYAAFCEQVKLWALDHGKAPFDELHRRVRELILCDKKSLQLLTIRKLMDNSNDDEKVLFDLQANIQQLCDEIGEKDDRSFVEDDSFMHSNTQFGRLKSLVQAFRQHSNYLVNQPLTRHKMVSVSINEQVNMIAKPNSTAKKNNKHSINKTKDNDDELEM